jgi:hypothetical protein
MPVSFSKTWVASLVAGKLAEPTKAIKVLLAREGEPERRKKREKPTANLNGSPPIPEPLPRSDDRENQRGRPKLPEGNKEKVASSRIFGSGNRVVYLMGDSETFGDFSKR